MSNSLLPYLYKTTIRCTDVAVPATIGMLLRRCGSRIIKVPILVKVGISESRLKNYNLSIAQIYYP